MKSMSEQENRKLLARRPVSPSATARLASPRSSPSPWSTSPSRTDGQLQRTPLSRTKLEPVRGPNHRPNATYGTSRHNTPSNTTPRPTQNSVRTDIFNKKPVNPNLATTHSGSARATGQSSSSTSPSSSTKARLAKSPERIPTSRDLQSQHNLPLTAESRQPRSNSVLAGCGSETSFFHVNEISSISRAQRPAPPVKSSSFVYANGDVEAVDVRPPPVLGSPFKVGPDAHFLKETSQIEDIVLDTPRYPTPEIIPCRRMLSPFFYPAVSPPKGNIHLSYRKGISQIIRPSIPLSTSFSSHSSRMADFETPCRLASLDTVSSLKLGNVPGPVLNGSENAKLEEIPGLSGNATSLVTDAPALSNGDVAPSTPSTDSSEVAYNTPSEKNHHKQDSATSVSTDERNSPWHEEAKNARSERRVLDLEISNSSLLAINTSLERQLRDQKSELKYLRRVSRTERSTRLSEATTVSDCSDFSEEPRRRLDSSGNPRHCGSMDGESLDANVLGAPAWLKHHQERAELRRMMNHDPSRHTDLLIEAQKINQSIRRCLCVVDQLIEDGNRTLDYRVRTCDNASPTSITTRDGTHVYDSEHRHDHYIGDPEHGECNGHAIVNHSLAEDDMLSVGHSWADVC